MSWNFITFPKIYLSLKKQLILCKLVTHGCHGLLFINLLLIMKKNQKIFWCQVLLFLGLIQS